MVENHRAWPRISTVALFDIAAPGKLFYDYSINLCEGGLYLETQEALEMGEKLTLQFTLAEYDHVFLAAAEVVWVNRVQSLDNQLLSGFRGAGIRFTQMEDSDLKMLKEFIEDILNPKTT